jgi:hypothetical protein
VRAMPALLNFGLLFSQATVFFSSNSVAILLGGPVTSLLIFGKSGFACMLVAVMQRPRLRQCTFHRLEGCTRLWKHPAFILMALVSLISLTSQVLGLNAPLHTYLWSSDAYNAGKRITPAKVTFWRPLNIFAGKHLLEELLNCQLCFAVAKLVPCVKINLSAFGVSITFVLVACAVWIRLD